MSVKFFGQFLIERGEIDSGQLQEALALMKRSNRSLGETAVEQGLLSPENAEWVNAEQRSRDLPFGVMAVGLGLLDQEQLDRVVAIQQSQHLYVGEALVRLGHLPAERLGALLDEFKLDQAPYQTGEVQLPEGLAGNRMAEVALDLLPKFAMRIARMSVKLGASRPLGSLPDFEHVVAIGLSGAPGIRMVLLGDGDFASHLSSGVFGIPIQELSQALVVDGVGEFLNVLAGNAVGILERDGIRCTNDPPDYEARPRGGWLFEMVSTEGNAALVLEKS
jgi:hypothetical protein